MYACVSQCAFVELLYRSIYIPGPIVSINQNGCDTKFNKSQSITRDVHKLISSTLFWFKNFPLLRQHSIENDNWNLIMDFSTLTD